MKLTGENRELGEKPVPVPLCPPQNPQGLTRDRTRASEVEGQRLTAWAMARPSPYSLSFLLPIFSSALLPLYSLYIPLCNNVWIRLRHLTWPHHKAITAVSFPSPFIYFFFLSLCVLLRLRLLVLSFVNLACLHTTSSTRYNKHLFTSEVL
jgi:hypothetical protein